MSHSRRTRFGFRPGRALAAIAVTSGLLLVGAGPATAAGPVAAPFGSLDFGSLDFGSLDPTDPGEGPGQLHSIDNFRDVAGVDGYATAGGKHMAKGVFYRSNQLVDPSEDDRATLDSMGLATVYDLRTDTDIALPFVGGEDTIPAGANYRRLPIDSGDFIADLQKLNSPEASAEYMRDMYRGFVTEPDSRASFGTLLTEMAGANGPEVFHCTSGKDRTGWASMLLQHIAGVADPVIMNDYLLTNEYLAGSIESTLAQIGNVPGIDPNNVRPMLVVDASYLEAGLAQVVQDYGSVDNYLAEGLGLDVDTIAQLGDKLVS